MMTVQRQTGCAIAALILSGTAGCSGNPVEASSLFCTSDLRAGVVVEFRDAWTNAPLARSAAGVVREGAFVDSLQPAWSDAVRWAAFERAGTYEVEVQRAGYATFHQSGVRVERDECHVHTVHVMAAMVPTP
jgi:hypothetical protein